jgi:hypothetical protein
MSAGTYDPFAMEKPKLKLGEHGEWFLGDILDSREAKINKAIEGLVAPTGKDFGTTDLAARVGALCEAACEDAEGLADKLVGLSDEAVHGKNALGVKALKGAADFVIEWFNNESSAGEG